VLVGLGTCWGVNNSQYNRKKYKNIAGIPSTPALGLFPSFSALPSRRGHHVCVLS